MVLETFFKVLVLKTVLAHARQRKNSLAHYKRCTAATVAADNPGLGFGRRI